MRNVSDKSCIETQNTHFVFNNPFFSEDRAVYEVMWEDTVQLGAGYGWRYGACALRDG